ncbi:hypothetical protein Tco_0678875 [Tanacetum coccineum]|uniref:Uncharacterized protein n=1 Tax=Tanacetum coccineum TaxID=301880 RepID=A0ABQ4XGG5_9ASTR
MIEPFFITNNLMGYVYGSILCPSKTLSVTDGATFPKENPNYPIWISNDAHVRMLIISTISEASFRHVMRSGVTTIIPEKLLGDEGPSSGGTKLNSTFLTAEVTFTKRKTMIKEHDQQAKIKATPRKLAYADSDKEAPAMSLAKGFSDRFSLESSSTSDTHKQTCSTSKSQKTPSKNKKPIHLRRSRRLEDVTTVL